MAPVSRNACCSGCRRPFSSRPSMVVMWRPADAAAGIRQERTATPSMMTVHGLRALIVIRVWIFPEQRNAGDDHARGAVAALHGAGFEKRLLQRMQAAIFLEAFDGGDVAARGCSGRHPAGTHGHAFHDDGACAALSFAAAVLGAGEVQLVPEYGEESAVWIGVNGMTDAVHHELDRAPHGVLD